MRDLCDEKKPVLQFALLEDIAESERKEDPTKRDVDVFSSTKLLLVLALKEA